MAYAQRYAGGFVNGDNSRQVDAVFLNNVETALLALFDTNPNAVGQVQVWNGTKFAPKLLTNAEVDPAAAIAKSKLAALAITDADVSGAAAISLSKLATTGSLSATSLAVTSGVNLRGATAAAAALYFGTLDDAYIQRNQAALLDVYRALQIRASAAGNTILYGYAEGDAGNRFVLAADGGHKWAPASGAVDTTLGRGGASNLVANGSFQVGFWVGLGSVSAAHSHPSLVMGTTVGGADPATTADSGCLYWNGTNLKFRKPSNGTISILV